MELEWDVWKEIKKEWDATFSQAVFSLGYGRKVTLLEGCLMWGGGFCTYFPSVCFGGQKRALVAEVWDSLWEEGG